jgi:hypothetical protein
MEATAVLILISDGPSGGTAIVLRRPEAPAFVVMGDDTEEGFARLRRGAIAYGMPETYQALPRDMIRQGHVLHVREDHRLGRVDKHGTIFGTSPDIKLWIPLDDDGTPFERMRVPLPSLERPAYVEFAFAGRGDDDALLYELDGEARIGDGFLCPYCGRLTEQKEPHTAQHGVGGHLHAGVSAGHEEDDVREPAPLTGPIELGGHPGTGSRL